jgi:Phage Tail Collar Domain
MKKSLFGAVVLIALAGTHLSAQSPFPCTANCLSVTGKPQGWIVGEIRSFAFGGDSAVLLDQMANNGWVECAGQSAIRKDFDELWRAIGTNWGSLEPNSFLLPDLRGVFIRGWQHGKTPPPDQATHVPPYTGDVDVNYRLVPRPEAANAGGVGGSVVNGAFEKDHVGSVQAGGVGQHAHQFSYTSPVRVNVHYASDQGNTDAHADVGSGIGTTNNYPPDATNGIEDHPSNAYVMYFIYVGKPAKVIELEPAAKLKGPLNTNTLECYKKSGKCREKMED